MSSSTSLPFVSPRSYHSTVTDRDCGFSLLTIAECTRPGTKKTKIQHNWSLFRRNLELFNGSLRFLLGGDFEGGRWHAKNFCNQFGIVRMTQLTVLPISNPNQSFGCHASSASLQRIYESETYYFARWPQVLVEARLLLGCLFDR